MSASLPPKNLNDIPDYSYGNSNYQLMLHRPALKKLLLDAQLNKFDEVLVYCHDRLGREEYELFIINNVLTTYKKKLHFCKEGEYIPGGDKYTNEVLDFIHTWNSISEAKRLSCRAFNGAKTSALLGIWPGGKPPFGYLLEPIPTYNKHRSILKINKSESIVVKEIFLLYSLGYSPTEICKDIKSKFSYLDSIKHFRSTTISDILRNETYTGHLTWNKKGGKKAPVRHSPEDYVKCAFNSDICIISKDLWNSTKKIRETKKLSLKSYSTPFLLRDIIKCSHCNTILKTKNQGAPYGRFYSCKNNSCKKIKPISANNLHKYIIEELQNHLNLLLTNNNFYKSIYSNYVKYYTDINNLKKSELNNISILVDENIKLISNIDKTLSLENNNVIINLLNQKRSELIKKKSLLKNEFQKKQQQFCVYSKNSTEFLNKIKEMKSSLDNILFPRYEDFNSRELRMFLLNFINSITIDCNSNIEIIFN